MAGTNAFQNAHDFTIHQPTFNNVAVSREPIEKRGLEILLGASIPAAAFDSPDHHRRCHPGTRRKYINQIVRWGLDDDDAHHRIFWLKGPAGVGKSAIVQSCAEEFAAQDKLAAAFFFSRYNRRDNPHRLFTSVSYQFATKHKPYSEILKSTIHNDPTIIDKEISHQFHHLFVSPLRTLRDEEVTRRVVIIDGLDECADETAQRTIIEIVAASIRDDTTPFIWVFCSRLEPHLVEIFDSLEVSGVAVQEEVTVSRAIDGEITMYLTDELARIGRQHKLPHPWPSEQDVDMLVNLSAGLFVYASTVVRFISDRNSLGPENQLRVVLALATSGTGNLEHPLSELDLFYRLILQRVPEKLLLTVQWILLATTIPLVGPNIEWISQLLDLPPSQSHTACRTLHSVIKVEGFKMIFYHASFMDFMLDPQRSGCFCIRSEPGIALRRELIARLEIACNTPDIRRGSQYLYTLVKADINSEYQRIAYENVVAGFLSLCSTIPLDATTLGALMRLNFHTMAKLWPHNLCVTLKIDALFQNIPEDYHSKIIRSCADRDKAIYAWEIAQKPSWTIWERSYILGRGQNKCFCWSQGGGRFILVPYPKLPTTGEIRRSFMKCVRFWKA